MLIILRIAKYTTIKRDYESCEKDPNIEHR